MESSEKDYTVARVTEEDISRITELEKALCSKNEKDIVLIAYERNCKAEK